MNHRDRGPAAAESPLLEQLRSSGADERACLTLLARTLYRELTDYGYQDGDVVAFAAELIEVVTQHVGDG